jgi:DNA polymerase alpha subunit A
MTINKMFPRTQGQTQRIIEIEIDGLFSSLLLYKKKKYAAMIVDNYEELIGDIESWKNTQPIQKLEIKGLDMIRRDWSGLTKSSGTEILKMLLKMGDRDDILESVYTYLESLMESINNNKVNSQEYVIYKFLTKSLQKYKTISGQPHVIVAKRLIDSGHKTEQ